MKQPPAIHLAPMAGVGVWIVASGAITLHTITGGGSVNGVYGTAVWDAVTCKICLRNKPAGSTK